MNPLKTVKAFKLNKTGFLELLEFEQEAFQRNASRCDTINRMEAEDRPQRPKLEPLRTWEIGQYDADPLELSKLAPEWIGKRTIPLREGEVEELRHYLTQRLSGETGI